MRAGSVDPGVMVGEFIGEVIFEFLGGGFKVFFSCFFYVIGWVLLKVLSCGALRLGDLDLLGEREKGSRWWHFDWGIWITVGGRNYLKPEVVVLSGFVFVAGVVWYFVAVS